MGGITFGVTIVGEWAKVVTYILNLVQVLLSLLALLYKDWHNYKHPRARYAVIAGVVIVFLFSCYKTYQDSQDVQQSKAKSEKAAEILGSQVRAANEAQTQNTKVFLDTLAGLSDRVRGLQAKVGTEDLRKPLASVQNDLQRTQKTLEESLRYQSSQSTGNLKDRAVSLAQEIMLDLYNFGFPVNPASPVKVPANRLTPIIKIPDGPNGYKHWSQVRSFAFRTRYLKSVHTIREEFAQFHIVNGDLDDVLQWIDHLDEEDRKRNLPAVVTSDRDILIFIIPIADNLIKMADQLR